MQIDPTIRTEILNRLSGGESLRGICTVDRLPAESTVRRWAKEDVDGFAADYAHARDAALDSMADELIAIADDGRNDWMEKNDPANPGYTFNGEHAQRSKLRVDTRKWILSKLAPKRYGDRLDIGNADGKPFYTAAAMSPENQAERLAKLFATVEARRISSLADCGSDLA